MRADERSMRSRRRDTIFFEELLRKKMTTRVGGLMMRILRNAGLNFDTDGRLQVADDRLIGVKVKGVITKFFLRMELRFFFVVWRILVTELGIFS